MSFSSSIVRRSRSVLSSAIKSTPRTESTKFSSSRRFHSMPSSATTSSRSFGLIAAAAAVTALSFGAIHFYQSSRVMQAESASTAPSGGDASSGGLNPKEFMALKLKSVDTYNHNTNIYHFSLPDPNFSLDLPVSSCVMTRYKDEEGKTIIRPYTPIDTHHTGELILLVKTYEKGKMSKHFANLKPGDSLDFKGPMAKLKYEPNMKKKLGFIVGGTGVTPALQVIDEVLSNPSDKTELHLLFANVSGRDILLKETIDQWAAIHKNFHVTYVIDAQDQDKDFKGEIGRVDKQMIEKFLPIQSSEGKDVLVYVCGPPAMYESLSGPKAKDYTQGQVAGVLKELGFNEDQVYKF